MWKIARARSCTQYVKENKRRWRWRIPNTYYSGYRRAIWTQIKSVQRQYYEACTGIICKKLYELDHFLSLYDVDRPINYFMIDRAKTLKQAKLGQFSMYWTETGHGVHQNWTYCTLRPLYCTVLPSNSLEKEGLCFKIVIGQAWSELYCTAIFLFSTHLMWTRIGRALPP